MKKLIKLTVLALAAISIMACNTPAGNNTEDNNNTGNNNSGNNNAGGTTVTPEPLISASDAATLTETGTLPADFTDGNWSYQVLNTSTSLTLGFSNDQYTELSASLTEDEIALITITPYPSVSTYAVTIPLNNCVVSTINNITKSDTTYTVTSSIVTATMSTTNATIKSVLNKCAAAYNDYFSWNGNTASYSRDQTSQYSESSSVTGLITSLSSITWKTNNDKTKFYYKSESDSNNFDELCIVKK